MSALPVDFPAPPDPNAPVPLTDEQLLAVVANEIRSAVNSSTSEIAQDQERALEYYEGRPFGNEQTGSSQVVMRTVAETVDWALPALMRAFFYSNQVVQYDPTSPDDEVGASQRTKVVNALFRQDLNGFRFVHDWAKAGFLEKFAAAEFWVEQMRTPTILSREGVTQIELAFLSQQPNIEVFEANERSMQQPITNALGNVVGTLDIPIWDIRYKEWRTYPELRLEPIPPEEFLCSGRSTRLDQRIPFVARQKRVTRSDLQSIGVDPDLVSDLPAMASSMMDTDGRAQARFADDDPAALSVQRVDKASQHVLVTRSSVLVDFDGDGYAERRWVLTDGDGTKLLDHDYQELHGFVGWTPKPMPHKLYGLSIEDVVGDLQRISSSIMRQLLDCMFRMNNPRHKLIAEEVDIDTYLDPEPGRPILVERMESIESLETTPLPPWSFEALQWIETVRERRTGIHPYSQEVYAAGQNQTAQGVSQVFEAAMAQIQLIAELLGEGLADLFRLIPRMMKQAGIGPSRIRVGDEWVDYNPQLWPDDMRVSVQTGLSPGQTEQKIQRLLLLLSLQEKSAQAFGMGYMVTPEQFFSTAVRIVEQSGFVNPSAFFTMPKGPPPPQPTPPEQIKVEAEARDKQSGRTLELARLEWEKERERENQARLEREAIREHERTLREQDLQLAAQKYAADRQLEAQLSQQATSIVDTAAQPNADGARASMTPDARELFEKLQAQVDALSARLPVDEEQES